MYVFEKVHCVVEVWNKFESENLRVASGRLVTLEFTQCNKGYLFNDLKGKNTDIG